MPGGDLDDLDKLMLEDQHLASHQIDLKKHLICYSVDVIRVQLQGPVKYSLAESFDFGTGSHGIFVALEGGEGVRAGFPLGEGLHQHPLLFLFSEVARRLVYFRFLDQILIIAGLSGFNLLLNLDLLGRLKHQSVVALPVGALLTRKDKALALPLEAMLLPKLLVEEFGDKGVIDRSEPLMHAGHHTDVVIVYLINFLKVELFWHVPIFVREYKLGDSLRHEWWRQYRFQGCLVVQIIFPLQQHRRLPLPFL